MDHASLYRYTSGELGKPEPETKTAILASAGHTKFKLTRHRYLRTELTHKGTWAFIFECLETGKTRRWGVIEGPGVSL
jgi:hypothetical protein